MIKGRFYKFDVSLFFRQEIRSMRLRKVWVYGIGFVLAASVAACGGGSNSASSTSSAPVAPAGGGKKVDSATAGEVKGTVALDGAAPKNADIKMNADPVCVKQTAGSPQAQETFIVGKDGKSLANVFVYVKEGLSPDYSFDVPTESAKIDQQNCRYHPHVFGMRVGQKLEIVNSDPTLHNIHAMPKANTEFNNGQPIQGMKMDHTFTAKEVMVPFKCDVHGWMNAYVGVLDHPFFAVTDDEGKFDLKGLPPGTYTIEAWHEKGGTVTQSVTVGASETKDITFTMKAPAVATN
jgi:plastocyanin